MKFISILSILLTSPYYICSNVMQSNSMNSMENSMVENNNIENNGIDNYIHLELENMMTKELAKKHATILNKHHNLKENDENEDEDDENVETTTKVEVIIEKSAEKNTSSKKEKISEYHISLDDINRSQYLGIISVGNPKQESLMLFDTGSSNLWVLSDVCKECVCKDRCFLSKNSKSYVPLKLQMSVKYGSGRVVGRLSEDTVYLGPIVVDNQVISLVSQDPGGIYSNSKFTGILGLSFPALSAVEHKKPIMDSIIGQNLLTKNQFSFYITDVLNNKGKSALVFGTPKLADFSYGDTFWNKIEKPMYWEVPMVGFGLKSKSDLDSLCSSSKPCKAVVDTGTTYLTGPSSVIKALRKSLPKLKRNCANIKEFPNLKFNLGKYTYELEPHYYIINHNTKGDLDCHFAFMSLDVPEPRGPLFILGNVFMRKFFTTFDRDELSVGFTMSKDVKDYDIEVTEPYLS